MNDLRVQSHEPTQHVPSVLVWTMVVAVSLLFGFAISPFRVTRGTQSSPAYLVPQPSDSDQFVAVAMTLTALAPTMTPYLDPPPTQTPDIRLVTVTVAPTSTLPWCREAATDDECRVLVPPKTQVPPTPLPSCELVTPYASADEMTYVCRKTNGVATNGDDQIGNDNPGVVITATPTAGPYG